MSLLISILSETPFFIFPESWEGWLGALWWLVVIVLLLALWRNYGRQRERNRTIIFGVLLVVSPLSAILIGLKIPGLSAIPLPDIVMDGGGMAVMVLAAFSWVLAAGLLGPFPAAALAAISGLILGFWGTHSIFTIFEWVTLAILLSAISQQRYRTPIYTFARNPIVAIFVVSLIYPLLYIFSSILTLGGSLAVRLDYALEYVRPATLALISPVLIAAVIAQFVKLAFPEQWGGQPPWLPSPSESSLEARFTYTLLPLLALLLLVFVIGDWIIAGNAAREMLQSRMAAATEVAADGVPFLLNTGQNLILQIAQEIDLQDVDDEQLQYKLSLGYQSTPFFHQLYILDAEKKPLTGYPAQEYEKLPQTVEELLGIELAFDGIPVQVYIIPDPEGLNATQISFIAAIFDDDQTVPGVLLGRTDFSSNPFAQAIFTNLNSTADLDGVGLLTDENGQILYQSETRWRFQRYSGQVSDSPIFYDDAAPDGTHHLIYVRPTIGRPWFTVMMVPAREAQQLALNIAAPVLGMIFLLVSIAAILIRLSLRMVTASLKSLTTEAERIAQGQLDHVLKPAGADEAGRLRSAFEKMRLSLKARLDELNRLLLVSQGVASHLNISEALKPIITSALTAGVSSARIVLSPEIVPDSDINDEIPSRYGVGKDTQLFSYFDDQILALMQTHPKDQILLTNPVRTPLLSFGTGAPRLGSMMAITLRHERQYYGVLWLGNDEPHTFADEEVQFLSTLGGQAAMAAANARLFMTAEFERERLSAILASTPDPVLVTDFHDRLLLINERAWQTLNLDGKASIGKPVAEALQQPELADLLRLSHDIQDSAEVEVPDGRVFMATASTIRVDDHNIGRVCVLKDITHFKELDALKSDFVSTVSHDLRSPLTLMRGYATMLEMVGDLNQQQDEYVRKIIIGIENITTLVTNLLDLGRIEAGVGLQVEILLVRDIVDWVVDAFQLQATQKRIELRTNIAEDSAPLIEADQALLQQALHNLVENAIKYTPGDGQVTVRIQQRNQALFFSVQDTGIGISPVDQPRLFEKFYRSSERKARSQRGTGLGLAIVKSIVERHGGYVGVESKLGEGSVFYFEIPLRQQTSE